MSKWYVGGCQNYGPVLGTPTIRCRIIIGTQEGTIILTTTHVGINYAQGVFRDPFEWLHFATRHRCNRVAEVIVMLTSE